MASFNSNFFTNNRKKLHKSLPLNSLIVITANGLLQRSADSPFKFAQDASFWYLTGIEEPDIVAVLYKDESYLIVPGRSASREAFDGSISDAELTHVSGIETVLDEAEGWQRLAKQLKDSQAYYTLEQAPVYLEQYGMYVNPARAQLATKLQEIAGHAKPENIALQLAVMRSKKQPEEIKAIQQAINITIKTLQEVASQKALASYQYEYEFEACITEGFRRRGATGHAYDPIVASAERACTLHYVANNHSIPKSSLIAVDVGAEVSHYAADITRTYSNAKPSPRQQEVYDAVLDVQRYAMQQLKPGIIMKDYEQAIEQYMGETLQTLGLIKDITHENVRCYYPHATSHFLGLNVHDVGDYRQPLQADMVMTVEPGIYIPEEGIGIRIEDDVLLTDKGISVLSEALPKKLW